MPAEFFRRARIEARALMQQGLTRSEAFQRIRLFNSGQSGRYVFHFTNAENGASIVSSGEIWPTMKGLGGPGVYAGTTPTPGLIQKYRSPLGWGVTPGSASAVRIPIAVTPELAPLTRTPLVPRWTTVIGHGETVPLGTPQ